MRTLALPFAIVLGASLVAAAIYAQGLDQAGTLPPLAAQGGVSRGAAAHVYGNPEAPTRIVEFSDFECPFCARLHPTLERLVDESGGTVAWEHRHFPLDIHPNADDAARASECVATLLGSDAFWVYTKSLFAPVPLTMERLQAEATALGVAPEAFSACLAAPETAAAVAADLEAGAALGVAGTPHSIITYADGTTRTVPGALPYEAWLPLLGR